jgi:aqualysin 1
VHKSLLPILFLAASLIPVGSIATQSTAQSAAPMIVRFKDGVSLAQFRKQFREDGRFKANPKAWNYLDRNVVGAVQALEQYAQFQAEDVFSSTIKGFAARLTPEQIQRLQATGLINSVEPDAVSTAYAQTVPWGIQQVNAHISSTQAGNGIGTVSNVNVYVLDTGVTHPDVNVVNHLNFAGGSNKDCNGHGTHVGGTIAAKDDSGYVVGVAPGAPVTGIKVLNCNGSGRNSKIIKGIDWVTQNAVKPAVANMSLGGSASEALDSAVRRSAQSGVVYVLAAGNEAKDACASSPARSGGGINNGIITVGATDSNNKEASFGNYGNCVDIWAPGVNISSTYPSNTTKVLSGTSMASPHVAGVAALFLSNAPSANPIDVEAQLKANAIPVYKTSKDGRDIWLVNAGNF